MEEAEEEGHQVEGQDDTGCVKTGRAARDTPASQKVNE